MPPSPPPPAVATEADGQPAPSLDCLPDGLLGHIIALVDREHWHNLPFVSHRWRQVFASEPGLRQPFVAHAFRDLPPAEQQSKLEQQAAALQGVAQKLVRFVWQEGIGARAPAAEASLARCLAALGSGRLVELELSGFCQSVVGTAAGLRQLRLISSLMMRSFGMPAAAAVLGTVGSRLRSLQLTTRCLLPALLDSIEQLPQLTALGIEAKRWPALSTLTRLSCLRQLRLKDAADTEPASMQPPGPASFPAGLERFSYESKRHAFEVAGCRLFTFRLWQGLTHGISLDQSIFKETVLELPLPTLALASACRLVNLAPLLSALQPAGVPPRAFQRLEIRGSLPYTPAVVACLQLRQLRELWLQDARTGGDITLHEAVAALLHHCGAAVALRHPGGSQLSSLAINSTRLMSGLETLPPRLLSYRGLTSLALCGQELSNLPAGDYLTDLKVLKLSRNNFTGLPPALSAATALTRLELNGNYKLRLTEADAAVLQALPSLRQLQIAGIASADPALLHGLQQRMPLLTLFPAPPDPDSDDPDEFDPLP